MSTFVKNSCYRQKEGVQRLLLRPEGGARGWKRADKEGLHQLLRLLLPRRRVQVSQVIQSEASYTDVQSDVRLR